MHINNQNILVTGGAGFIGSHLVDLLLKHNNRVVVVDDFSSGKKEHLAEHAKNKNLQIIELDILDEKCLYSVFNKIDYVFHLACRNVRLSLIQPTVVHDVNTTGTLNVLKAAAFNKVKGFLYCSSSEVNGTADIVPMPEEYHFKPETIYGASKLAGEYYTQVFHRAGWLKALVVRPHNNYGPREHYQGIFGEVIPRFILSILSKQPITIYGTGQQTRDFTFVTDTVYFMSRLLKTEFYGKTFNICKGQEVSILSLVDMISSILKTKAIVEYLPSRPNDVLRLYGDNQVLFKTLGEVPAISIHDGLTKTVEWFKQHYDQGLISYQEPKRNWENLSPEQWLSFNNSDRAN